MTGRRRTPKEAIAKLAARDPDFRQHYTLEQLAQRNGVTRQRIWQIVGPSGYRSPARRHRVSPGRRKVEAFLRKHPEAIRRPSEGGMSDDEIARRCGVTRSLVVRSRRALGLRRSPGRAAARAAKQSPRTNDAARRRTVRERLQELEAREPDFLTRYTSTDLGAMLGVTPQAVRLVLGPLGRDGRLVTSRRRREQFVAFLQAHPRATAPILDGGMRFKDIAQRLDVSPTRVAKWWRELALPPRPNNLGGSKRCLRREVCVECGRTFDWTAQKEMNFRRGRVTAVVCGTACGIRQGRRRRGLPLTTRRRTSTNSG